MWSKTIQDWLTIERNASGPTTLVQSSLAWVPVDAIQDAQFLIGVSYVSLNGSHLYLRLETAPSADPSLFQPVESPTDLVGTGGTNITVPTLFGASWGPPLGSYVRWAIDSADSTIWSVTFRIIMSAL